MSALPPKSPATAAPFSDAFGYRVLGFDKKSGDRLEMLRLRPQLASSAPFEAALRERQRRLTDFRHPSFARVRQIDRPAGQTAALAVVSNHFEGMRLSELLKVVETHGIRLELVSALCLLRQVASAIARLHECGEDISHGALNPERLVVSANGRIVVTEYVLGAGLEALSLSRQQVWQDYRVALPSAAAPARMDHAADIYQLGYVGLTLVSGRSLYDRQYPPALSDRLQNAEEIVLDGRSQTLHPAIHTWLGRALWIDQVPFISAAEAQTALDEAIATAGLVAPPDVVVALLERCFAAVPELRPKESSSPSEPVTTTSTPVPSAILEPRAETPSSWTPPAGGPSWSGESEQRSQDTAAVAVASPPVEAAGELDTAASSVASLLVDAQTAARSESPSPGRNELTLRAEAPDTAPLDLPLPASQPAEEAAPELPPAKAWTRTASSAPAERPAERPRPEPKPEASRSEPGMFSRYGDAAAAETARASSDHGAAAPKVRTPYLIALGMAVVMVTIFELVLRFANPFGGTPAEATATAAKAVNGTLAIDATPKAKVFIDDVARGETPLRLDLASGTHRVRLEAEGGAGRAFEVNVIAGREISQLVELSRSAANGVVEVKSDPAGARVLLDGKPVGVSPVSVADVKPGAHTVLVEGPNGVVRQVVQVTAGATSSIVVPLNAALANVPTGGWLTIEAPEEMQVYEAGRLLGTSRSDRIMVPAGTHDLELRNDAVAFSTTRNVQVQAGKVSKLAIQVPDGTLSLNAVPWAEVWVDGQRIGDTPVGNVTVRAGTHEIVFRHPQHGEVRQTVVVKAGEAGRVTVNMAK